MRPTVWVCLLAILFEGLSACAPQAQFIDASTKRDEVGNYVIHWETMPVMNGKVDIFVSDDPHSFPSDPMITAPIAHQMVKYIPADQVSRKFFLLVFNQNHKTVTAVRLPNTDSSINLRDIGGYVTTSGKAVSWGMIARSGALVDISKKDRVLLSNLRLRSRVILSESVYGNETHGDLPDVPTLVIPTEVGYNYSEHIQDIKTGGLSAEGVRQKQQEYFKDLAYKNKAQFSEALHFLLEPANYPVLISDTFGKDRVGFFIMLLQSILEVSHNDIIREYTETNHVLSASRLFPDGYKYSSEVQETLTEFFRCRDTDLNNMIGYLVKRHGSMSKYIAEVLDFGMSKQRQLQCLLLFNAKLPEMSK
ncbi:tyrosine-protein phosphatase [Porphyromonas sp.]|uniref:tyrosine-protein phosphatase n=1 Tax=Porphyromonas sp. TaxID=1924944 RepID=UPI0026DD32C1|nr:tyrosine-protein phosphatase [Porphyromonas sp.]MDO4771205.1 tyrosine-protein phosphatase [Porphyromonas sp.]